MIKYRLACKDCHTLFDTWFASSKEYERLKKKNMISCYKCDSLKVEKTLMSPKILKSYKGETLEVQTNNYKRVKKKILKYQKFIKENFKYVGEDFAHEARSVHYNDKKNLNGIYGSATKQDLKELKEEGIEAEIIPWIEDRNN